MKKLALILAQKAQAHARFLLALLVLSGAVVGAGVSQQFTMPPPAGVAVMGCVYNASPPTLTTGNPGFVQCSSTGGLVTSGGGGGGGGAVTMAPGAVSTGAYQTGAFAVPVYLSGSYAAGSIASGAVASGAYATGAFAAGSGVNGWDANAGATTDSRCTSAATACTMNSRLADMEGLLNSPLPAGSAIIGKVGIDQTTPGTTNLVALAANQSVNVAQIAGTATATGSGVMTAGVQRTALATDSPGIIALGGATPANSVPVVGAGFTYANINTATTTTVKSGAGVLHSICINTANATSTAQIYDNTAGSGTKIGLITHATAQTPVCFIYDVAFSTGLTIVSTTGTPDYTVSYR